MRGTRRLGHGAVAAVRVVEAVHWRNCGGVGSHGRRMEQQCAVERKGLLRAGHDGGGSSAVAIRACGVDVGAGKDGLGQTACDYIK